MGSQPPKPKEPEKTLKGKMHFIKSKSLNTPNKQGK